MKKDNQEILDGVFKVFENEFKRGTLYVLTIEPLTKAAKKNAARNSFFKNLVSNNEVAEIMITNYEIHSFDDPDANFVVYDFESFMSLLKKYIHI